MLTKTLAQQKLLNHTMPTTRQLNKINNYRADIKYSCHVVRSMPFEYIESPLKKVSQTFDYEYNFTYTDYDPSLREVNCGDEDVTLFWIDWRLYKEKMTPQQVIAWIRERIKNVNGHQSILINNWPLNWDKTESAFSINIGERAWYMELNYLLFNLVKEIDRVFLCDLDYLVGTDGHDAYDSRNDQVSSYPFSNRFTLILARYIGLTLLPAILEPKLKLIVLDLDYTMYRGVLGEDGQDGIIFEEAHLELQRLLIKLKGNGILLAISSKNELEDVYQLIENHPQFILKKEDFVFIEANWQEKQTNIHSIINRVNINPSATVFIDDNVVELSKVTAAIPSLHLILADETGEETWHRLRHYPGIYSLMSDSTASKRRDDIVANSKRVALKQQSDNPNAYLNSLQMKVGIYHNEKEHIDRIADLSQKTNQFNTNMARRNIAEVTQYFNEETRDFYTITLSDFLSDSGIIGVFSIENQENKLVIDEVLFSCRALGRQVESFSLLTVLKQYPEVENIQIKYTSANRNGPAEEWLKELQVLDQDIAKELLIEQLEKQLKGYDVEVMYYE